MSQMPDVIWDYSQYCVSLVSSSLAPRVRLRPYMDGSCTQPWLTLVQWQGWVNISYTTAEKPSDSCFSRSSFPYRFSGLFFFCLSPHLSKIRTLSKTRTSLWVGVHLSCKGPFPHWHLRVPFTVFSWGICRKRDSNDVPITRKVQQREADLGSELECSFLLHQQKFAWWWVKPSKINYFSYNEASEANSLALQLPGWLPWAVDSLHTALRVDYLWPRARRG